MGLCDYDDVLAYDADAWRFVDKSIFVSAMIPLEERLGAVARP